MIRKDVTLKAVSSQVHIYLGYSDKAINLVIPKLYRDQTAQ